MTVTPSVPIWAKKLWLWNIIQNLCLTSNINVKGRNKMTTYLWYTVQNIFLMKSIFFGSFKSISFELTFQGLSMNGMALCFTTKTWEKPILKETVLCVLSQKQNNKKLLFFCIWRPSHFSHNMWCTLLLSSSKQINIYKRH